MLSNLYYTVKLLAVSAPSNGPGGDTEFPTIAANEASLKGVLQLAFGIIGTLTVIYIMYAAIRISMSQGDPQTIAKERQAIIFAIVGLVIVLSAELIVTFALGRF